MSLSYWSRPCWLQRYPIMWSFCYRVRNLVPVQGSDFNFPWGVVERPLVHKCSHVMSSVPQKWFGDVPMVQLVFDISVHKTLECVQKKRSGAGGTKTPGIICPHLPALDMLNFLVQNHLRGTIFSVRLALTILQRGPTILSSVFIPSGPGNLYRLKEPMAYLILGCETIYTASKRQSFHWVANSLLLNILF